MPSLETSSQATKQEQPPDEVIKMLVEGKISDGDISGALRVLSLKDSVAAPTPQVPEVLSEKHEAAESSNSSFSDPPNQGTLPDEVATEEVIAAVKSFPNGSAGGVDGLRPHLKDMIAGPPTEQRWR